MASLLFKNVYLHNYYFGCKTFEGAEIKMQRTVIDYLLNKNKIDLIIGGDLSNQLAISSYMACKYDISYIGMYSACATFNSSLITMSNLIDSNKIKAVVRTAENYLNKYLTDLQPRFDAAQVIVEDNKILDIEYIINAFESI